MSERLCLRDVPQACRSHGPHLLVGGWAQNWAQPSATLHDGPMGGDSAALSGATNHGEYQNKPLDDSRECETFRLPCLPKPLPVGPRPQFSFLQP
jgi:hypothetical protein